MFRNGFNIIYQPVKCRRFLPLSSVNCFGINQLLSSTCLSSCQYCNYNFYSTTGINSQKKQQCPFRTLNVKSNDSFDTVKKRFLELAFRFHPDTSNRAATEKNKKHNRTHTDEKQAKNVATQKFLDIRVAFKSLEETQDGGVRVKENQFISDSSSNGVDSSEKKDEDFDNWFRKEMNHHNQTTYSFLDARQVRELVEVTEKYSPGGLDKGGMWDLAKAVRQKVDRDGLPPLEINSGTTKKGNNDKGLGRRRRKR